jgi:hypothetical protein
VCKISLIKYIKVTVLDSDCNDGTFLCNCDTFEIKLINLYFNLELTKMYH